MVKISDDLLVTIMIHPVVVVVISVGTTPAVLCSWPIKECTATNNLLYYSRSWITALNPKTTGDFKVVYNVGLVAYREMV